MLKKTLLIGTLITFLTFGFVGTVAKAESGWGFKTFLGEELEFTLSKTVTWEPFELELFYDHGKLNTILNINGKWDVAKSGFIVNTKIGGGAWFEGTFWPVEEITFEEIGLEFSFNTGIYRKGFSLDLGVLGRWDEGLNLMPIANFVLHDSVVKDFIASLFAEAKEATEGIK